MPRVNTEAMHTIAMKKNMWLIRAAIWRFPCGSSVSVCFYSIEDWRGLENLSKVSFLLKIFFFRKMHKQVLLAMLICLSVFLVNKNT